MSYLYTIMVVDDIEYSRSLVEAVLLSAGYNVLLASSGKEVLERLSPQVDLLIVDALMPIMSGFELVENLKQKKEYEDLPILMATGLSDKKNMIRAYKAGVDGLITKPFDRITLQMNVRGLIKQRKAHIQTTLCRQKVKDVLKKLQKEPLSPASHQLIEETLKCV